MAVLTSVATKVGISPALLISVCMTETNLRNVDVPNDGDSTSYGVCQVKLKTAHFMARVHKKPRISLFGSDDMRVIENNAKVAALYIKYQLDRYEGDACKAVAAYNAGRFKESSQYPGVPFNWKYVEKVEGHLGQNLGCADRSVASR